VQRKISLILRLRHYKSSMLRSGELQRRRDGAKRFADGRRKRSDSARLELPLLAGHEGPEVGVVASLEAVAPVNYRRRAHRVSEAREAALALEEDSERVEVVDLEASNKRRT
jgi:hypothetical protein